MTRKDPNARKTPSTTKRMILMLVGVAVIIGGVFAVKYIMGKGMNDFFDNMPQPAATVTDWTAKEEEWVDAQQAVGTFVAVNGTDVTTEAGGVVRSLSIDVGKPVKAGTVLAQLNTANELAVLKSLEASAKLAAVQRDRWQALARDKLVSQAEAEERLADAKKKAETEKPKAEAEKAKAEAPAKPAEKKVEAAKTEPAAAPAAASPVAATVPPRAVPKGMSAADFVRQLLQEGENDAALATVQEARKARPTDMNLVLIESIALIRLQQYREAAAMLVDLAKNNPRNAEIHATLGAAMMGAGFYDEARETLLMAVKFDKNLPECHFNLAQLYALVDPKDLKQARKHYKQALDLGVAPDAQLDKILK